MLQEETYDTVYHGLKSATDAMSVCGDKELLKDKEDVMIYKRLLHLSKRVAKQGMKAQKLKRSR